MTKSYSFRTSVIDTLIRTKRPDVPMRVALRNTAAVVLPLAAGMYTGYPQVGGHSQLHIAHVLWGGLLLGVAMTIMMAPPTRVVLRVAGASCI